MPKYKNYKLFFLLLLVFFILGTNFVFALEITYPKIPGAVAPQDFASTAPSEQLVSLYFKYIFTLFLYISGVAALGVLIYAGIQYFFSIGDPAKMLSAKEQASSVIWGLLILFSSVLIIKTINPGILTSEIKKLPQIDVSKLPPGVVPPEIEKFNSAIDTEIPVGIIIEKNILETTTPQGQQGKPRMQRIKEIGTNTVDLANQIKTNSEQLKSLIEQCSCDQAQPVCTDACTPSCAPPLADIFSPTSLADFNSLTGSLGDIIGTNNLPEAFAINASIAEAAGNSTAFSNVMDSFQNINELTQSANLPRIFEAASKIADSVMMNPTNLGGLLGSTNDLTRIWGKDLTNIFDVIQPIQGIIDNPTNLSGVLNSINDSLGNIPNAPDLTNFHGLDLIGIGQSAQIILNNPTNIGAVLNSANQLLSNIPDAPDLSNFHGLDVVDMGFSMQSILNNPGNLGGILGSINQALSNIPNAPDLSDFHGLDVVDMGFSMQNIINNPYDLGGALNSIDIALSNIPNAPDLSDFHGLDVVGIGDSIQAIMSDPSDIGGVLISVNDVFAGIPDCPDLTSLRGVNIVNIVSPIQIIMDNPTNVPAILQAINTISIRSGGGDLSQKLRNTDINEYLQAIANNSTLNNALVSVNGIFSKIGGPNLNNISGVDVIRIVAPTQNIVNGALSGDLNNLMIGVNQISSQLGVDLRDISIGGRDLNLIGTINYAGGVLAGARSGNFGLMMGSLNQITTNFGTDLTDINIGGQNMDLIQTMGYAQAVINGARSGNFGLMMGSLNQVTTNFGTDLTNISIGGQNIDLIGIMNPVQGILAGARSGNLSGMMGSMNQLTTMFGTNLTDLNIAGQNIDLVGIMGPVQGVLAGAQSGNFGIMMNSANEITKMFGTDLTNINNINLINDAIPFANLMKNPLDMANLNSALQTLSNYFPSVANLQNALQNFQGIANIINNPVNFSNIMGSLGNFSSKIPAGTLGSALGNMQSLGTLPLGNFSGFFSGFICGSCTCDPCKKPRPQIQETEQKNLKAIYQGTPIGQGQTNQAGNQASGAGGATSSIVSEQNKATQEIRLLKEEIGKLETAEMAMIGCPLPFVNALDEYLLKKDLFLNSNGFPTTVNFWKNIALNNDWAAFYCQVSGSTLEPKNSGQSQSSYQSSGNYVAAVEEEPLKACNLEVPIGELIDRVERLGYKIIERLEKLIALDEQLIKEVDKLHSLVSQCTSQVPRCKTICIPTEFGCIERCVGSPCLSSEVAQQVEKINQIVSNKNANNQQGIIEVVQTPQNKSSQGGANNKALNEQVGLTAIIDQIVPAILKELGSKIRKPMQECVVEPVEGISSNSLRSCDASIRNLGPDGQPIKNCCYEEAFFTQCLDECYLETGEMQGGGTLFKQCFSNCLDLKAQQLNSKDISTCRHLINFYCCSI